VFFARYLEAVVKTTNADFPCQLRLILSDSAKERGEVIDGVDVVFLYGVGNLLWVGDIHLGSRSAFKEVAFGLRTFDITANDISRGIFLA
jgi:hypothetical protein